MARRGMVIRRTTHRESRATAIVINAVERIAWLDQRCSDSGNTVVKFTPCPSSRRIDALSACSSGCPVIICAMWECIQTAGAGAREYWPASEISNQFTITSAGSASTSRARNLRISADRHSSSIGRTSSLSGVRVTLSVGLLVA
jgi:hypothetical protein